MKLRNDSITVVILGDWNRLFIQPDWVAGNVFETPEIEIGIEGAGSSFSVTYKKDMVLMKPTQSKVEFSIIGVQDETLKSLEKCINNYLKKAYTPVITAYGFNADYVDAEDTKLAEVFDTMSDADIVSDLGYEIKASEIKRSLIKDEKIINMQCKIDHTITTIHFNEHHPNSDKIQVEISADKLRNFLEETKKIVEGLGYEIEVEVNE